MLCEDSGSDSSRFDAWQTADAVADVYEVRDVITVGGMALGYRVWRRGWWVELAVKTPRPDLLDSPLSSGADPTVRVWGLDRDYEFRASNQTGE